MRTETLQDIIARTRNFHQQLQQRLKESGDASGDTRAALLLDYLCQFEQSLAELVTAIERGADGAALNTWCYEYLNKHPIDHLDADEVLPADAGPDRIMEMVMAYHNEVIGLYRFLHRRMETESSRELMANLKTLEEQQAMQMMQAANRLQDA
ncbi:hypothetical protein [Microbulbifer yueqingensis]|uniref:ATPase n=1 Tax=Microbulbifer yueqingensis TaxID=658219 RepID=A0A1G8Y2L7_9GAMM|nr:hypothetical protein [Microbulbifer yueqingensis]SDJ97068.1 hypothetical protein SAMN05216212_1335 [Microbulbifer yueqingensis]